MRYDPTRQHVKYPFFNAGKKREQAVGVVFQPKTYQGFQRGINLLAKAIRPTLGPLPRQVAMAGVRYDLRVEFLDNGADIARHINQIDDPDEDVGAMFLREVLWNLQMQTGDGTATAAVLFASVFNEGVHYITSGGNASRLNLFLHQALELVIDELNKQVSPLESEEHLVNIAESHCFDPLLAKYLGEMFDVAGEFGRVEVRPGNRREHEREYFEGMYWDVGLFSREMITDMNSYKTELENAAIIISDFDIQSPEELYPVLETALRENIRNLFIMAKSLSPKAINFLLSNRNPERLTAVAVKNPGLDNAQRKAVMEDIAILTGAKPFVKDAGETFLSVKPADYGLARKIWADHEHFGFSGGKGDPRSIRKYIQTLRTLYQNEDDVIIRDEIRSHIGRLLGGTATVYVSGSTDEEIKANVENTRRTIAAMRTAMLEGVVPGGGLALLECIPALNEKMHSCTDIDERAAYYILTNALRAPFEAIVGNAGYKPDYVRAQMDAAGNGHGFDVKTGKVVRLDETGILDPASLVKTVAFSAISSAALALTVDVLVHHRKPEKAALPERAKIRKL